ncbi:MAG: hypothetical protein U0905_16860 [Pirellulales bacterium]
MDESGEAKLTDFGLATSLPMYPKG